MFDISFGELLVVMVVGLVVLGPKRLPVAVKTVAGWIRAMRTLATSVQQELAQELKLQELQESLKKVEQSGLDTLTPELKTSIDELKQSVQALQQPLTLAEPKKIAVVPHDDKKVYDQTAISAQETLLIQPEEKIEQPVQAAGKQCDSVVDDTSAPIASGFSSLQQLDKQK